MRSRIHVWEPQHTTNDFGEDVPEWVDRGTWHAERVKMSGRRQEEADEHFTTYNVSYNVRIQHHCEPGWQVDGDDGLRYIVAAVEPYQWLGMQTIICERLNQ